MAKSKTEEAADQLDYLVEPAMWRYTDVTLTNHALTRLGCGLAWLGLAISTVGVARAWPGMAMVAGDLLAVLHSQRALLQAAGRQLSKLTHGKSDASFAQFFPFVAAPHFVDGPGFIETTGLILAGLATGTHIDLFAGQPDKRLAAIALMAVAATSYTTNLIAHPSWEMQPANLQLRLVRPLLSALVGAAFVFIIAVPPHERFLQHAVWELAIAIAIVGAYWTLQLHWAARDIRQSVEESYDAGSQEVVSDLHTWAKNLSRQMLESTQLQAEVLRNLAAERPSDAAIQELRALQASVTLDARGLGANVSALIERKRSGSGRMESPQAIVTSVVRLYGRAAQEYRYQLDSSTVLPAPDAQLVRRCVGEFIPNALQAKAGDFRLEIKLVDVGGLKMCRVRADCDCEFEPSPTAYPSGTLGRLTSQLQRMNGSLEVQITSASAHSFIATWPASSQPDGGT